MKSLRVLAGALALMTILCSCGTSEEETTVDTSVPVETQAVTRSDIATQSQLSGKVIARNEVEILSPIAAKVLSVNVAVGDAVSVGQLLFSVDPESITKELSPMQAERSRTAALYDSQIAQAQSTLSDTKTLTAEQVRQAQQTADNTRALYAVNAASSIDVEQADAALTQTKLNAQQSVAQAQLSVQQLQTSKANALATYDKNIQDFQDSISDTHVTSTVAGTITAVSAVQGSMASTQAAAVTIATNETPQILVSVSEAIQPWLSIGDTIPVTIAALGDATITTTIDSIAPAADATTHLFDVRLNLPTDTGAAYGMFATALFATDSRANAVLIPTECILTDETSQYVFTVNADNTAVYVPIQTGLVGNGVTEVSRGLDGGETLVTKGQSYLSDGARVRIVNADAAETQNAEAEA